MKKMFCFFGMFVLVWQTSFVFADVSFDVKLPFPKGDSRGVSCIYQDTDPLCVTHAEFKSDGTTPNRDEWAIDFNLVNKDDCNEPVVAIASGKVLVSGYQVDANGKGYGKYIDIDHENGYKSRYAHLNLRKVKAGEKVVQGQKIGEVGDTGTNGCHLHFALYEVYSDGSYWSVKPTPMSGYDNFYSTYPTSNYPFLSDNDFNDTPPTYPTFNPLTAPIYQWGDLKKSKFKNQNAK